VRFFFLLFIGYWFIPAFAHAQKEQKIKATPLEGYRYRAPAPTVALERGMAVVLRSDAEFDATVEPEAG
jgi:hypothetical protein